MFLKNSRYANVPQVQITLPGGTQTAAVELRSIPTTPGDPTQITSNDRLDVMAQRVYSDPTKFWHIADANSALDSLRVMEQWLDGDENAAPISILVPES